MDPDRGSSAFWRNSKVSLEEGLMPHVRDTGVSPLWPYPLCQLVEIGERKRGKGYRKP